jgi:hypothetical protein
MPKTLFATVQIELSDDQFNAAGNLLAFKPEWDKFLLALNERDVAHTTKLDTVETRAKPATGAKRGRKPKPTLADVRGILREPEVAA